MMKTALLAVIEKYRTIPEFLAIDLVDPNQHGNTGDTLLHIVAFREALEDMEILVACGAEINALGDLGDTPLHQAASAGKIRSVKKLLAWGADATIKNEDGETALDLAEMMGHSDIAKLLKERMRVS